MKVSYNKLWKLLIDMNLNKTKLREMAQMSPNTMAKLGKNETISMDIILRICEVLKCDVGDIMETIPDEEDSNT
ncbi:helix-turn-helix domain-containing protein [Butyrivibrio fibrisolvens]|jgi:DNA-binding Xre family transcriptional regulator|uniref:helix-turn-helix domain-containing protein n=1 Tax=Butyrivibrio fibrisolvens TaxID=831 RepID=UPI000488E91E|nr:helix-turn-helix transcriptional regulator [Butyrivibrio fibrisolvens]